MVQPLQFSQPLSEHDTSQRSSARHSLEHTLGQISHPFHRRHGNWSFTPIRPDCHIMGKMWKWSCKWQERREETRAGRGRLCWSLWVPFCGTAYVTTQSDLGKKDMISSGANFLGALKNDAGEIWSTVIMEKGKDTKVAGRAPGPGIPEYLKKGIIACTISLSNYPWCLSHDYHCSLGEKRGWGGQIQSTPYQSAVLRKSDSMEEKVNLVSMVTKVWKKYTEINVILTCMFTYRPTVIKSYSAASVMRPCNRHETIRIRSAVSSSCAWLGTTVSPPGETFSH